MGTIFKPETRYKLVKLVASSLEYPADAYDYGPIITETRI